MRITAEEKAATRERILSAAKVLFRSQGFAQATTRDIATEVGLAVGTMFNYFPTKEAIVVELAARALEKAKHELSAHRRKHSTLEESLFASIATQLRCLRPLRRCIGPLIDSVLSPVTVPKPEDSMALRTGINAHFVEVLGDHGVDEPTAVQLNIFWSLYVGVLAFWSSDKSPKQEDSLALLDQSVRMYVDWLGQ